MHAQLDAVRRAPRDAEQLDPVAELLGVADVLARELRDALGVDLVELHRHAEGDRRHDRELVRGVDAFDVERRVGLGVAARLRLGEHVVERRARRAHLGQDEVGRAVDDAGDPFDAVRGEALAQRLDDRDAAGDRASNATITPFACAAAKISLPCRASSALFAVTTCLPFAIACSTNVRAGSMPPISSTTMSMSGCASTVAGIVGRG